MSIWEASSKELPKGKRENDCSTRALRLRIDSFSRDQVMNDATYLQEAWPHLDQGEKRKIVECITNKIVIGKKEVEIDLCYLPSSKDMSKRDRSLPDSRRHFSSESMRTMTARSISSSGSTTPARPTRSAFGIQAAARISVPIRPPSFRRRSLATLRRRRITIGRP
jgi:hypothetical protein